MSSKVVSSKCEVETFLKEIKEILVNPYTTGNTLLALDFDMADVVHQLMALELSEYLETFIDDKDNSLPPFFAFAKSIQSKDVYIKVKIRDRQKCKVFCVSFHFAKYPFPVKLPYA